MARLDRLDRPRRGGRASPRREGTAVAQERRSRRTGETPAGCLDLAMATPRGPMPALVAET
jgi:hypothetical protein